MEKWSITRIRQDLQPQQLGRRPLLHQQEGEPLRPPVAELQVLHRPARAGRRPDQAQDQAADPAALHGRAPGAHRLHQPGLQECHRRKRLPGQLPDLLPDQGQPAAPGGRGHRQVRQALQYRPRGRLQARAGGRHLLCHRQRPADHLQRLQGHRVHRDGAVRHQDRLRHHHRRRKTVRTGEDHRTGQKDRHHPEARHPGQALLEGDRQVGDLRRRGCQVRPAHLRDHRRHRNAGRGGACSTASSCCTPTSAARSPRSTRSRPP